MPFKIAAQESTLVGDTLEEKFAFAQSVGFDGIELSGQGDGVFGGRADELRAARRAGVVMPSAVVHMDHFIGDFDDDRRRDAVDQLKVLLTTIVEAGGQGIVTPHAFGLFSRALPPFTPPQSDEKTRDDFLAALSEVADHAVSAGAVAYLEPLNRFEDFVVNTLADSAWYVKEIGSPGLAVIADTFHMSIEEADIAASLREHAALIKHVQLGDSNRLEPGAGHYDWDETLDTLDEIGYDGWLAMECGLSGPSADVLPGVARLLKRQVLAGE
jgi:sugar phosphate isomerase/epimerase